MPKTPIIAIFLFAPLLAGCTTPRLLAATGNSVTYEYDNSFISSKFVAQTATSYCSNYGKKAVLRSSTLSPDNQKYTDIFDCK